MPPTRCHIMIGPPSSGKSTLAAVLAEQVGGQVIATDVIRSELFGDEAIQGPWAEVEAELHKRVKEAVAAGTPVIVDATHCRRPYRLALTQALELPTPVQWIGWWLTTPLEQCLAWNRQRTRRVEEKVIKDMHGALPSASFQPTKAYEKKLAKIMDPGEQAEKFANDAKVALDRHRSSMRQEGFSAVEAFDLSAISDLPAHCRDLLAGLDTRIKYSALRIQQLWLHRYSRLLDLERLLFTIRLLLEWPGLSWGEAQQQALRESFNFGRADPFPPAATPFPERVAFVLAHRHGACYGSDSTAVQADLDWLKQQGFVSPEPVTTAVVPGPPSERALDDLDMVAGMPPQADRAVFQRQLGLLRHLIQNPFDRPSSLDELDRAWEGRTRPGRRRVLAPPKNTGKEAPQPIGEPTGLREYLLQRLQAIGGVTYEPTYGQKKKKLKPEEPKVGAQVRLKVRAQVRLLDKDIETLISGYLLKPLRPHSTNSQPTSEPPMEQPKNRRGSGRGGFGLGTALLTATQLKEVHALISQAVTRLNDPTQITLQKELEERLKLGGIDVEKILSVRAFANRSIIETKGMEKVTMAHSTQLEKVEAAIMERRQIRYRGPSPQGEEVEAVVWPLQILFHNIGWYLAFESDPSPGAIHPLLTVARLDRLRLLDVLPTTRDAEKARASQERLGHLCRRTGGIFLGSDAELQSRLGVETLSAEEIRSLRKDGSLITVRFRCSPRIFGFMREGNNRYPAEQIRLSGPLPQDSWDPPAGRLLDPCPDDPSHPYPVELLLPNWTVEKDTDFRRWLFGFGSQIRIEAPDALREEHHSFGAGIAGLYATESASTSATSSGRD